MAVKASDPPYLIKHMSNFTSIYIEIILVRFHIQGLSWSSPGGSIREDCQLCLDEHLLCPTNELVGEQVPHIFIKMPSWSWVHTGL